MLITSGIYCFENLIDGKKYVGQSINLERRFKKHINDLNKNKDDSIILQNAWNKYGKDSFIYTILIECSLDLLDEKEKLYIKELHTHISEHGYNISWGGNSPNKGIKLSEETKQKLSKWHTGRKPSFETRLKLSTSQKGRKVSEETRKKISIGRKGIPMPKEAIERARKNRIYLRGEDSPMFGTHLTKDIRLKISRTEKGKKNSKETKQKMTETRRGQKYRKNSSSKYVGVSFRKDIGKWKSYFNYNRERISIGYFETEIEAALAYNEYAQEFYGWKAKLNQISQKEINDLWECLEKE
jgi:group I intron endonuclease